MKVKVVSFCTAGPYAEEAKKLRESCDKFGLDCIAVEYTREYLPTWKDAVCLKPDHMFECLILWDNYDYILWTDADSFFVKKPDFDKFKGCDVAWHKFKRTRNHEEEFLTGTMLLRPCEEVISFARAWGGRTREFYHTDTPEQRSLKVVWPDFADKLKFMDLGPDMVYIHDDFKSIYPKVDPVIIHTQASRKYRRE